MKRPQDALEAIKAAEAKSVREPPDTRIIIETKLAEGRAMAWADMGDLDRAVEFGQEALKVTPSDPELWTTLARFYEAPGPREPGATGAPESGSSHSAEALALPLRWSLLGKAKRGLASSIAWDRPTVISLDISTCRAVLSRRSFNTA